MQFYFASFHLESSLIQLITESPKLGSQLALGRHRRCRDGSSGQGATPAPGTGTGARPARAAQPPLPPVPSAGPSAPRLWGPAGDTRAPSPPAVPGPGRAPGAAAGGRSPGTATQVVLPLIMRHERCVKPWLFDCSAVSHDAARWLVEGNESRFQWLIPGFSNPALHHYSRANSAEAAIAFALLHGDPATSRGLISVYLFTLPAFLPSTVFTHQSTVSPSSFLQEIPAAHRGTQERSKSRAGWRQADPAGILVSRLRRASPEWLWKQKLRCRSCQLLPTEQGVHPAWETGLQSRAGHGQRGRGSWEPPETAHGFFGQQNDSWQAMFLTKNWKKSILTI